MNVISENPTHQQKASILLWVTGVVLVFLFIPIPAYVVYEAFKSTNPDALKKQLRTSILATVIYLFPYSFLFMGMGYESSSEATAGVVNQVAFMSLVLYLFLHLAMAFVGTRTRNLKMLRILVWLPAVVMVVPALLVLMSLAE